MVDIRGKTAHEVITKSIDFVMENGNKVDVWGGTIPKSFGDNESPSDYKQTMVEYTDGFSYYLENPRARWSEISRHWPGITLRETEDDLFGLNPGMTPKYSKVYRESGWLQSSDEFNNTHPESTSEESLYPHTYGRRLFHYGDDSNGDGGINQWEQIKKMILKNPTTRKATMTFERPEVDLFLMESGEDDSAYVPCNVEFQVRVIDGELHWHTHSRSKDILRGSTENLFEFPVLQELFLLELQNEGMDVSLGPYVEQVDNVHIYQDQIDEGYLEHNVKDVYDYCDTMSIDSLPWELESKMKKIDDYLLNEEWVNACYIASNIESDYWRNWKLSLVIEYVRMKADDSEDLYMAGYVNIDAPWKISLAKRAYREYGAKRWITDDFSENIDEIVRFM